MLVFHCIAEFSIGRLDFFNLKIQEIEGANRFFWPVFQRFLNFQTVAIFTQHQQYSKTLEIAC